MSVSKHFVDKSIRDIEIDEFLSRELDASGYGGIEIVKTPLGSRLIIYAMKPGLVIGYRGAKIRELSNILETKFKIFNPQIAVSEIEVPELNPKIMASRIAKNLQDGTHFRRACYWALNQIMKSGAIGCEIVITGKLSTERHRHEKYAFGYLPKAGDPAIKLVKVGVVHVLLKPGIIGIRISISPSDARFPDLYKLPENVALKEEQKKIADSGNSDKSLNDEKDEVKDEVDVKEEN